ncbi:unnamed protein product [Ranitomeya imitator]|uniref:MsrB domain-containing protein n=1 Tax=Ranitomeya imitator TaxID=111125 RepID=A0ABN9KRC4_9NEOB|nr:unnamed protein product [Ranitomeya imitator]
MEFPLCYSIPGGAGVYVCAKCGYELFNSRTKFEHSSPWPAFSETIHHDSVSKYVERPNALKTKSVGGKVIEPT